MIEHRNQVHDQNRRKPPFTIQIIASIPKQLRHFKAHTLKRMESKPSATVTAAPAGATTDGSSSSSNRSVAGIASFAAFFVVAIGYASQFSWMGTEPIQQQLQVQPQQQQQKQRRATLTGMQRLLESESETDPLARLPGSKANELVKKIAQKLTPVPLRFVEDDAAVAAAAKEEPKEGEVEVETVTVQKKVLEPHQFLHLHHMKVRSVVIAVAIAIAIAVRSFLLSCVFRFIDSFLCSFATSMCWITSFGAFLGSLDCH